MICDSASIDVYRDAVEFLTAQLGCVAQNDELLDVDNSIWQTFKRGSANIKLISDTQINYVPETAFPWAFSGAGVSRFQKKCPAKFSMGKLSL